MSAPTVRQLAEAFEAVPLPAVGDAVDLDAAKALTAWLSHPHVCSGGNLSSEYVPPYLAALVAQVERLQRLETWLVDFEKATAAIPCGHEIPERGCSTYNWHSRIAREARKALDD